MRILSLLTDQWTEIEPSRELREIAFRILRLHPLWAAHSMQLVAALVWADGRPAGHELVCLDQRLRDAAAREGFRLLPTL
ncbi:hypothetical protein [Nitrospira sp. Kam-Ns4a]